MNASKTSWVTKDGRVVVVDKRGRTASYGAVERVEVPSSQIGFVLGAGKRNLQRIKQASGVVKIEVVRDGFELYGSAAAVARATKMIREKSASLKPSKNGARRGSTARSESSAAASVVSEPSDVAAADAGKGGYFLVSVPTVREIRDFNREIYGTNRESISALTAWNDSFPALPTKVALKPAVCVCCNKGICLHCTSLAD
eukprot:SAG31_NODE_3649_length_4028_cov_2.261644_2_plen_200_part_00